LIQLFLKWIKLKSIDQHFKINFESTKIDYLIKYFNFLLKLLLKYEIIQSKKLEEKFNINPSYNQLFETFLSEKKFLSQNQILKLYFTYDKIILNSQIKAHIQLNSQVLLITKEPQSWLM
jgi:hypothetical protein